MFGKVRAWSRRHGRLLDALRVAPLALVCAWYSVPYAAIGASVSHGTYLGPVGYTLLSVTLLLPLLWRSDRPKTVFAVIALLCFGQWLADVELMPADFAVLVALYALSVRERFGWALAGALVAELGVVLALSRWENLSLSTFFSFSIFGGTVFLAGLYSRTRRRYVEGLEERAERAERERDQRAKMAAAAERTRIARELHDVVAHNVSVIVVQADGAAYALDSDPELARRAVRTISKTGRDALAEMRRLVGVLRQDESGPDYLPQPGLAQLDDLVRGAGLPVELRVSGAPAELPEGEQLTVYRIVQEALTNALKHGGPGVSAVVELDYTGPELLLRVTDNGRGAAARPAPGGHGLVGMRERAGMYGGAVTTGPRAGGGYEVAARLPVPAVRAA
ncbi:sensor histidine kinase [Nonomuraea sp. NPDC050328]|uniref:sensor histidine kinase n=1 Tax=Nonomuraea sp. NPDC050328 TaxID=3364361 RepID=UPI00378CE7FF